MISCLDTQYSKVYSRELYIPCWFCISVFSSIFLSLILPPISYNPDSFYLSNIIRIFIKFLNYRQHMQP